MNPFIVVILLIVIASLAVLALASGGVRRLAWTTVAAIPVLIVIERLEQLPDSRPFDWFWVVFSVLQPLTAAFVVHVAATRHYSRFTQWLLACGACFALSVALTFAFLTLEGDKF